MRNSVRAPLVWKYPKEVGTRVYAAFRKKHEKGSDLVLKMYGAPANWPIILVCTDSKKWENFKKTVKLTESIMDRADNKWTLHQLKRYLAYFWGWTLGTEVRPEEKLRVMTPEEYEKAHQSANDMFLSG